MQTDVCCVVGTCVMSARHSSWERAFTVRSASTLTSVLAVRELATIPPGEWSLVIMGYA